MDHEFDHSDSDSEPEEVTASVSKVKAQALFEQERLIVNSKKEAQRERRRKLIERNIQQKQDKQQQKEEKRQQQQNMLDIEPLPQELLEEVQDHNIEKALEEEKTHVEQLQATLKESKKKKSTEIKPKKTKQKVLETPSTRFRVVDLTSHVIETQNAARRNKQSCFQFRDRMFYNPRRLARMKTAHLVSLKEKQAVASKR